MSDDAERPAPTDLGNARRLVLEYGDMLRYVPEHGRWLVWWDGRWKTDTTGYAERAAKEVARRIVLQANDASDERLGKWGFESQRAARLRAMLELARTEPEIVVSAHQLDADPMALNVLNGTLDLETGTLYAHDPRHYHTRQAPVQYAPAAECPTWLAFVSRVFARNDELIGLMQRWIGYCLTGLTSEQALIMPWGTGANGKSTLIEALRRLMGDYAAATDTSTFTAQRHEGARNDLARLQGVRFVSAIEVERGARLSEALVKSLTGQDRITARFLFREHFEYVPAFKICFAVNHKPTVRGTEHALWRRIRLIPFTVTIPPAERDPRLVDRLAAEASGILNWALIGLQQWRQNGLGSAGAVDEATEAYRLEMDVLADFITGSCVTGSGGSGVRVGATELYRHYRQVTETNGEHPMSRPSFVQALTERGFERRRSGLGGGWEWHGISLRTEVLNHPEPNSGNLSPTRTRESIRKSVQVGSVVQEEREEERRSIQTEAVA